MPDKHPSPLLAVEGVTVEFVQKGAREKFRALDKVNLTVNEGETVGLVGESGSGKTTLGRVILRMQAIQEGRIRLRDMDITHFSERTLRPLRRQMQMVFQDPASSFNPRQSIGESLRIALTVHKLCQPSQIEDRIVSLLKRVGLPEAFRTRLPHEVSGGQLQRVAIARALALQPALIIADEAVSKLDVSVRSGVLNLLRDIQQEERLSLIFITHDLEVARFLSHKLVVLYHGKVLEEGLAEVLFTDPLHPYTRMLLSRDVVSGRLESAPLDRIKNVSNTGCRYVQTCPYAMDKCRAQAPVLEPRGDGRAVACWRADDIIALQQNQDTHDTMPA